MVALRLLHNRLFPVYNARGEDFRVIYLTGMFDWERMAPKFSKMQGAWATRKKKEAPHSYVYTQRQGSPVQTLLEGTHLESTACLAGLALTLLVLTLLVCADLTGLAPAVLGRTTGLHGCDARI
jgi:hypothetical protein